MVKFYAFCGIDLTGKTTVCSRVIDYLRVNDKRPVLFTARPNKECEPCLAIYNEAKKEEYEGSITRYMLFAANNALNFHNKVLPWSKKNKNGVIISDRCLISALAYNIIDTHLENDIEHILQLERQCCNFIFPDKVFYLFSGKKNLDPYNALKNRKKKLESNDLKDRKFKLKLLKRYDKAIDYYNYEVAEKHYVIKIDIDEENFMEQIYKEIT